LPPAFSEGRLFHGNRDRVTIGFFGRRNVGKSSVVNAVTGQQLAVVSEVKGTTTDPVQKAMELLPLGSVLIIDTPGLDDEGTLGEKRVRRARKVLNKADVAVLVTDAAEGMTSVEEEIVALFKAKNTPYIIAYNKSDLLPQRIRDYTGADPEFDFTSGGDFPDKLSAYGLIVHCGACMLSEREMKYRLAQAGDAAVPMTNYGVLIAHTQGILRRALDPFPDILSELGEEQTDY
jgi:small GTP-binding protein